MFPNETDKCFVVAVFPVVVHPKNLVDASYKRLYNNSKHYTEIISLNQDGRQSTR